MFEQLYAKRPPNRIKPGLERIKAAYDALGKPGHKTRTILVAGTNGKGTTAGYLTKYLETAGQRVGLYTSPHLIHFSERFYMTDKKVADEKIQAYHEQLERDLPEDVWDELSFFEIATLIAFIMFENVGVDFRVLEVGLGGRWDATNVVDPEVSIITSIGIDHVEYLGDSITGIAFEKAGVMRAGKKTVVGSVDNECKAVLDQHASSIGCDLEYVYTADAPCDYLVHNLELAWRAAAYLGVGVEKNRVQPADTALNGRFQQLDVVNEGRRSLLVDVCHNVAGSSAFVQTLQHRHGARKFPALVSIMNDKDVDGILDVLRSILSPIVLFQGKNIRSFNRLRVASRHRDLSFFDDFNDAFAWSVAHWDNQQHWVVCGSVATVGEVLDYFRAEHTRKKGSRSLSGRSPIVIPRHQ